MMQSAKTFLNQKQWWLVTTTVAQLGEIQNFAIRSMNDNIIKTLLILGTGGRFCRHCPARCLVDWGLLTEQFRVSSF